MFDAINHFFKGRLCLELPLLMSGGSKLLNANGSLFDSLGESVVGIAGGRLKCDQQFLYAVDHFVGGVIVLTNLLLPGPQGSDQIR